MRCILPAARSGRHCTHSWPRKEGLIEAAIVADFNNLSMMVMVWMRAWWTNSHASCGQSQSCAGLIVKLLPVKRTGQSMMQVWGTVLPLKPPNSPQRSADCGSSCVQGPTPLVFSVSLTGFCP